MMHPLHPRIAKALKWSVEDCQQFSLAALRDLVRPVNPALAREISEAISSGSHVLGQPLRRRRRNGGLSAKREMVAAAHDEHQRQIEDAQRICEANIRGEEERRDKTVAKADTRLDTLLIAIERGDFDDEP